MKKYLITVEYLGGTKEFLANRVGNNLYYDHENTIGCSVIDIRSKRLINYKKYSQVAELVDATLSRLEMPDSLESVEMCEGNIGDS